MISHRVFLTLNCLSSKVMANINQKYGRLTILDTTTPNWYCKCDCGNFHYANKFNILKGRTKSCGCGEREARGKSSITHNLRHHPLYNTWNAIRARCNNKNVSAYPRYGGRGITICERWNDFKTFYDWAISNGWQKGLTIDRRNNNLGYTPDNCRVATYTMQSRNTRKNVLTMEMANYIRAQYKTGKYLQKEIAKELHLSPQLINQVIKNKIWL